MTDRVTTSTTTSWFSRIGDSLKGIAFAVVLLTIGCSLLIWNETNAVKQYKTIQEGRENVIEVVDPFTAATDPTYHNQLVHVVGHVQSNSNNSQSIGDTQFGMNNVQGILKLQRTVEMYQWIETSHTHEKKNTGGSSTTETTYEYNK